jgi:hypothetical protein
VNLRLGKSNKAKGKREEVKGLQLMQEKTGYKAWKPFPVLVLIGLLLCGCEIWSLERGIKQMGRGIEEAEGLGMEEAALYHLKVARSLLEAAEAQYEQADFPSATQFLDQSEQQLARARRLHTMSQPAPP